jgi:molecular chaperone GrpE
MKKDNKPEEKKLKTIIELEEIKVKAEEYLNGWKRAQADYQNFKKESEKQQSEIAKFVRAAVVAEVIPIYNNLKLALKHAEREPSEWSAGVEQVVKQFDEFLKKNNIEPIKTLGVDLDPNLHESVGSKKVAGKKKGEIVEEVKPGYKYDGQVLIPAQVIVGE